MSDMTFVELFAGVGGMSRGLEMAGWRCVGHAEWDDHARAVLRRQWPEVPLWGDVSQLNGHDLVQEVGPFTMLTFGAPCQDFSIAGKRSGMDGERSVLVLDALRIWEESQAPFALYENVVGMLSSNKGEDFAAILSVFVGDAVAVPARGWRGGGGVVRGRRGVAAWRVLDAQYFGVPQRRRRVFVLGTRTGSLDPAEVLALLEGVSGHPATRRAPRQGVATDAGRGASSASGVVAFAQNTRDEVRVIPGDKVCALAAEPGMKQTNYVLTFDARGNGEGADDSSLTGDHQNRVTDYTALVMGFHHKQDPISGPISPALGSTSDGMAVVLRNHEGKPGPVLAMASGQANAEITENIAPSLTLLHEAPIAFTPGVPRRLTPVECERLMGWPDGWTAQGLDAQGRPYALSDTARYKACGNGVASPVAAWIGFRLREALTDSSWEVTDV